MSKFESIVDGVRARNSTSEDVSVKPIGERYTAEAVRDIVFATLEHLSHEWGIVLPGEKPSQSELEKQFLLGWRKSWINQPSTQQRWHCMHGVEVWAQDNEHGQAKIMYIDGLPFQTAPTLIDRICLSDTPK
jgi:hypothetical protein